MSEVITGKRVIYELLAGRVLRYKCDYKPDTLFIWNDREDEDTLKIVGVYTKCDNDRSFTYSPIALQDLMRGAFEILPSVSNISIMENEK